MVFKKGQIPWNKGLTKETDIRVEKYSNTKRGVKQSPENIRKNSESHKRQIPWHKGKTNVYSLEALKRISEGTKRGMTKEICKKISQRQRGKILSEEHKKKVSAGLQGISLENWKGFTSKNPYDINFNNKFRRFIRKRDNQICMNCSIHREKLNECLSIHHINYDKELTIPENCISLCRGCHTLTNKNREYWQKLFQEKLFRLYNYQYKNGEIILKIR